MTTLNDFTKDELVALAPEYAVELKSGMSKAAIVKAFEDDGVTAELINSMRAPAEEVEEAPLDLDEVPAEEPEEDEDEELVLIRMTRTNGTYQIRGYTFKRDHPFALVKEKDADYLVEIDGGFRMASPKEAREYYS